MQAAADTSLSISNLPVAPGGPFAMTVWFQQYTNPGDTFQYLISARSPSLPDIDNNTIFYPNQVHASLHKAAGAGMPALGLYTVVCEHCLACTLKLFSLDLRHSTSPAVIVTDMVRDQQCRTKTKTSCAALIAAGRLGPSIPGYPQVWDAWPSVL